MIMSDQQPCARRSSAAWLAGLCDHRSPFGTTSICQAGIEIEAANETAITRSNNSAIKMLVLNTAATNVRVHSMVNDYSYRSVSIGSSFARGTQRKRPLQPAARRWDLVTLPEGTAQGEENLRLNSCGGSGARLSPDLQPSCHARDAAIITLKPVAAAPSASLEPEAERHATSQPRKRKVIQQANFLIVKGHRAQIEEILALATLVRG